jgi:DNA-binding HxlR family transcriptional regulator
MPAISLHRHATFIRFRFGSPRVDYSLTSLGRSLAEAIVPLCAWGTENMAEVARVFSERERWSIAPS